MKHTNPHPTMPSSSHQEPQEQENLVVYVVTLGCAKNLVDAEVMCGTLAANGIFLTDDPEEANVTLVNTCGFIQSARDEAEAAIRQALQWKRKGARKGLPRWVVVGGCLAQRSAPEYAEKLPGVDLWMGVDSAPRIHQLLKSLVAKAPLPAIATRKGAIPKAVANAPKPLLDIPTPTPVWLYDENTPRIQTTPDSYAYVKIAEGCNHRCAFCAIPGIRGNLRSRSLDSIMAECRQFLQAGVKELNLIAQDTTAYGRDLKPQATLVDLLKKLDELPGEFWVRILYTHPVHITPEFLEILGNSRHVVPYLDVPLQHIDTPILESMRRRIDEDGTRKLLKTIREKYPQITIRTTVMTGYPGETPESYQKLLDFVKEFSFDRLGAFAFSPEPGTPAYEIKEGLVPVEEAERRRDEILALQREISLKRNLDMIGKEVLVLLEDRIGRRHWRGRTTGDAPEVDQTVFVEATSKYYVLKENTFVTVKVTHANEYDLGAVPACCG